MEYSKYPTLNSWVINQREQYIIKKRGNNYLFSDERIVQLEKLRFQWNSDSKSAITIAWDVQFSELFEFTKEWGH